jgi:mannose-6-phosphate isomerase-like protein (cupin superfamily)
MERVDPRAAAAALDQYWSQQVLGEANGSLFKVAKGLGETKWHAHDDLDEVFLILEGRLVMQLRTGDVELNEGDMFIVPRGVEHCPRADEEVHFLIVGPEITSNAAGGKPDWSYEARA